MSKKRILAIVGSASENSTNHKLVDNFVNLTKDDFEVVAGPDLKILPHFDPKLSADNPPRPIIALRNEIEQADGVLICTPEYVFSIPSGLKNAIEWCISTTVFSEKPVGLITAGADGKMGHEELKLIMKTAMAKFTEETTLLIQGARGKVNEGGQITDPTTLEALLNFIEALRKLVYTPTGQIETK